MVEGACVGFWYIVVLAICYIGFGVILLVQVMCGMSQKLSSKKFLELFDVLWQEGPRTEYKNPDAWVAY